MSINAHCCIHEQQQDSQHKYIFKSTLIYKLKASELGNLFPVYGWKTTGDVHVYLQETFYY